MSELPSAPDRGSVKSADRLLDLFELLDRWNQGLTHTEIADWLDIPKSSLSQLLKNVVARGYLMFDAGSKLYRLGPRLALLSRGANFRESLVEKIQPHLERVTQITQESCFLNVLAGDKAQLVAREIGPQPLVTILKVGQVVTLHNSAGGRAILAFVSDATRTDYIAGLGRSGKLDDVEVAQLTERLNTVRQCGYALSQDEFALGVTGLAVPILSNGRSVIGSLIVSMPSVRFDDQTKDQIIGALKTTVAALDRELAG